MAAASSRAVAVSTARFRRSSVRRERRRSTARGFVLLRLTAPLKRNRVRLSPDPVGTTNDEWCYILHAGSPSPAVLTTGFVVFTAIPHDAVANCECVFVADHIPGLTTMAGAETPVDCLKPNSV